MNETLSSSMASRGGSSDYGDLAFEARRRLSAAGAVVVLLGLFGIFMRKVVVRFLIGPEGLPDHLHDPDALRLVTGLLILLGVSMGATARWARISTNRLLDLGSIFMVLVAAIVAYMSYVPAADFVHGGQGVSWVGIWILVYPSIVQRSVGKTLVTALIAATMSPLAMLLRGSLGLPTPPWSMWPFLFTSTYVCALLSVMPAKIMYKLARALTKARAMGSYELTELLGKGGMGEVWRAKHKLLARPAAVKLVRKDILGEGREATASALLQRFVREAQATSGLNSPHSIELYDFGIARDGSFYYVMELLDGIDLDSLVRRFGPVPPQRAVHLLRQVCHSLADAHANGLIHRDIKPANLFTCRKGLDHDFVKVLDFGLVKVDPEAFGGGDMLQTAAEVTTGTPAFMAPEMAVGEREIDHRVDLYAVGCVGYWLLTGCLVFESDNPMKMIVSHAQETPVPASKRSEIPMPPALDELILRCLAKKPSDRPASAHELDAHLAAIESHKAWDGEDASRWWQIHLPSVSIGAKAPEASPRQLDVDAGSA